MKASIRFGGETDVNVRRQLTCSETWSRSSWQAANVCQQQLHTFSNYNTTTTTTTRRLYSCTDLNLYCIKAALALVVLVSFSGYVR